MWRQCYYIRILEQAEKVRVQVKIPIKKFSNVKMT